MQVWALVQKINPLHTSPKMLGKSLSLQTYLFPPQYDSTFNKWNLNTERNRLFQGCSYGNFSNCDLASSEQGVRRLECKRKGVLCPT